jgi:hypothetical protein
MDYRIRQKFVSIIERFSSRITDGAQSCEKLDDLISAYADGEVVGKEKQLLEAHLDSMKAICIVVTARPQVVMTGEMSGRLRMALAEEMKGKNRFPIFSRPAWAFSTAAFAAVLAIGFFILQPSNVSHQLLGTTPTQTASLPPSDVDQTDPEAPSAPMFPIMGESGIRSASSSAAARSTADVVKYRNNEAQPGVIAASGGAIHTRPSFVSMPHSSGEALAPRSDHSIIAALPGKSSKLNSVNTFSTTNPESTGASTDTDTGSTKPAVMQVSSSNASSPAPALSETSYQPVSLGRRLRAAQSMATKTSLLVDLHRENVATGTVPIVDNGFH